ncbi:hypothetical protein CRUP_030034 [Coryphaenoides rupestris]|nr:hypothetical protein CRUP_030034 [Coryphaenoides rupestris]
MSCQAAWGLQAVGGAGRVPVVGGKRGSVPVLADMGGWGRRAAVGASSNASLLTNAEKIATITTTHNPQTENRWK